MPTLDATFTWAVPVNAAQLAAHVESHILKLPVVNTVRACNRFGKGPQCHINRLPVELVQRIIHYYLSEDRETRLEECVKLLRCYEDTCTVFDHYSREDLLEIYDEHYVDDNILSVFDKPDRPNDEKLLRSVGECELDETSNHYDNRLAWELCLETWLSKESKNLQKHFGVDAWVSQTCIGTSRRYMSSADTTVAYLTLLKRAERSKEWQRDLSEDGYESTHIGYGFAVAVDQHATSREIQNLNRAMRILDLEVFVHETQQQIQESGLSLASDEEQTTEKADSATSFPRPMFLVRNHIEGE